MSRALFPKSIMTPCIKRILRLNNESASLLCSGEEQANALSGLSTSLSQVRLLVAGLNANTDKHEHHVARVATNESGTAAQTVAEMVWNVFPSDEIIGDLKSGKMADAGSSSDGYFIFNRCLHVKESRIPGTIDQEVFPLYSVCILLNLGLAYHREAVSSRSSQSHSSSKCVNHRRRRLSAITTAEGLYAMALRILNAASMRNCSSLSGTILSMKIIAVNNLTQLLMLLDQCPPRPFVVHRTQAMDSSNSRRTYSVEDLLERLGYLLNEAETVPTFFSTVDKERFGWNQLLWTKTGVGAAAA